MIADMKQYDLKNVVRNAFAIILGKPIVQIHIENEMYLKPYLTALCGRPFNSL